jgi:hypothetical protein
MEPGTAMRSILSLLAAVLLAGACSKASAPNNNPPPNPDTPPPGAKSNAMSTLERVRQWAGPGNTVTSVSDITVDGLELFWIAESTPGAHDLTRGRGVAVPAGAQSWLAGKDAMRAALDRGVTDPALLAHLSMLLLEHGGAPIVDIGELPDHAQASARQAGVHAPRMQGNALEYWSYYRRTTQPELMRSRLDLGTLEVESKSARELAMEASDPIDLARSWLASPDEHTRRRGIEQLVAHCGDPRAPRMLAETLTGHAQAKTRAEAAKMLAKCHDGGSVAALVRALDGDGDAEVRQWAASTLGALGGPAARAALEKAKAGDQDENVRLMAQMALAKLK